MIYLQKKSIAEIPPATGSVSDTLNVTDKITNAPSIRLVKEMIEDAAGGGSGDIIEDGTGLPKDGVIAFDGVEEDIPEGFELVENPDDTKLDELEAKITSMKQEIYNEIYPIGRVIVDETGTDYSKWLGFTWERTLQGVSPVGIKSDDTDFDTVGKTGGSKTKTIAKANLPNYTLYSAAHTHTQNAHTHQVPIHVSVNGSSSGISSEDASQSSGVASYVTSGSTTATNQSTTITVNSGGSGTALDVMNPYKIVAFWKRVA